MRIIIVKLGNIKKERRPDKWSSALLAGKFVHAEFMIKNSKQYASTGGWGFERWKGSEVSNSNPHAALANDLIHLCRISTLA